MSRLRYAAYGSNLHPERLARRVPSATLEGTAPLPGMSLHFHKRGRDGSGKASLRPGASERGVHVAIYTLDVGDKPTLDRYEHLGIGYHEHALDVAGFGRCFTYLATPTHIEDSLAPFCWYHELVVLGCNAHGFPADYVDEVRAVDRREDPDERRRRHHWELVRELQARQRVL